VRAYSPSAAADRSRVSARSAVGHDSSRLQESSMTTPEITTILGKGSAFDGKLTFEGAVRIDGEFSGEIRTQGTLIVGESAEVKAQINAARIVIEGVVRGDITASEAIEIHAPARVYGNLATPALEIQRGSVFEGNCQMETQTQVATSPNGQKRRDAKAANATEPTVGV
jgi:cytoskeletal protein CcmA (bactofilin family)